MSPPLLPQRTALPIQLHLSSLHLVRLAGGHQRLHNEFLQASLQSVHLAVVFPGEFSSSHANDFIVSPSKHSAITQDMEDADTTKAITRYSYAPPANNLEDERTRSGNDSFCYKDASGTTLEVMDSKPDTSGEVVAAAAMPDYVEEIFPNSSHRDGSIYSGTDHWKIDYRISDRNETWLEAMMFPDPTDCRMRNGTCMSHTSCHMLQFLSLRLAKVPAELGSVELYGYIAARDNMNPLLNYIVNFSRDDPIMVKQGSLFNMSGPKRGIELVSFPYEATIEVVVSQVQNGFSMCVGCFTSGLDEEIRLFDGAIGGSCVLKRSVVAVSSDDEMELKLKIAPDSCTPAEYCCCFEAEKHGRATQEIYTGFALITVKVTWSTLNKPRRTVTTLA
ncbi:hypothetical protein QYE76_060832 [Lolium multiflorum]|uniref:DUF6598 domain-containing protein n=1 Tax=Lolium multiflorum TaxID=4521 RepID=A0AAD8S026_LOLMU|nr:hypothetical protein QYE76_060832 [Lolium multiflorum]